MMAFIPLVKYQASDNGDLVNALSEVVNLSDDLE
jgi:hypothetical protein